MKILGPFARVTTAGRTFIPQIDGLRFFAIMSVIAFHVREIVSFHFGVSKDSAVATRDIINQAFTVGSLGVQLFFAISGFILVLPFAKQYLHQGSAVSLRAYFLRRITRLEPPYVIHLGFLILLCALIFRHVPAHAHLYHNADWWKYVLTHVGASLFYVNGFVFSTHPYPNIVLWSLEVEVQFYLLAPFLASLFKITNTTTRRLVTVVLILTTVLAQSFAPPVYLVSCSLAGNLQYFLVGFLLCDFYLMSWGDAPPRNWQWDFTFLFAGAAVIFLHHSPFIGILLPWLILLGCCAAFKGRRCHQSLSNPWIATIGGMCYTIYMYHWFMISALIRLTAPLQTHIFWLDLIIQFGAMSVVIVAVCSVLFVLFERPFMRRDWPARFWATINRQKKSTAT